MIIVAMTTMMREIGMIPLKPPNNEKKPPGIKKKKELRTKFFASIARASGASLLETHKGYKGKIIKKDKKRPQRLIAPNISQHLGETHPDLQENARSTAK